MDSSRKPVPALGREAHHGDGGHGAFSRPDVEKLPELRRLDLVLEALPDEELAASLEAARGRGRCRDFSADRGLDCGPLKAKLWQRHGVRPLTRPPYPERAD